ncbi:unnamed protein product [Pleuronectes platessa]|uniref:Uncharacterized protein n=1 Tax=Pleuronectes platessa TaxID=8262 RepID=A0A9N7YG17_PLEPL|nr:unnamed protein product [Pleuronectes platessa]
MEEDRLKDPWVPPPTPPYHPPAHTPPLNVCEELQLHDVLSTWRARCSSRGGGVVSDDHGASARGAHGRERRPFDRPPTAVPIIPSSSTTSLPPHPHPPLCLFVDARLLFVLRGEKSLELEKVPTCTAAEARILSARCKHILLFFLGCGGDKRDGRRSSRGTEALSAESLHLHRRFETRQTEDTLGVNILPVSPSFSRSLHFSSSSRLTAHTSEDRQETTEPTCENTTESTFLTLCMDPDKKVEKRPHSRALMDRRALLGSRDPACYPFGRGLEVKERRGGGGGANRSGPEGGGGGGGGPGLPPPLPGSPRGAAMAMAPPRPPPHPPPSPGLSGPSEPGVVLRRSDSKAKFNGAAF